MRGIRDDHRQERGEWVDLFACLVLFAACSANVDKVKKYVQTWLQYQVLWDVDVNEVIGRLADDIETWQHLLNEIKAARSTFDTHENREVFGATFVDHRQVRRRKPTRPSQNLPGSFCMHRCVRDTFLTMPDGLLSLQRSPHPKLSPPAGMDTSLDVGERFERSRRFREGFDPYGDGVRMTSTSSLLPH